MEWIRISNYHLSSDYHLSPLAANNLTNKITDIYAFELISHKHLFVGDSIWMILCTNIISYWDRSLFFVAVILNSKWWQRWAAARHHLNSTCCWLNWDKPWKTQSSCCITARKYRSVYGEQMATLLPLMCFVVFTATHSNRVFLKGLMLPALLSALLLQGKGVP